MAVDLRDLDRRKKGKGTAKDRKREKKSLQNGLIFFSHLPKPSATQHRCYHPLRSHFLLTRSPPKDLIELAVGGVALTLADNVVEFEIGSVVCLHVEDTDELGLERVLTGRINHLLFDLGILWTEGDEDQFVATNSLAGRESDVITSVAAIALSSAAEQVVGELLVIVANGVAFVARGIRKRLVYLDALQVVAQFVHDTIVGFPCLHILKLLDAFVIDRDA